MTTKDTLVQVTQVIHALHEGMWGWFCKSEEEFEEYLGILGTSTGIREVAKAAHWSRMSLIYRNDTGFTPCFIPHRNIKAGSAIDWIVGGIYRPKLVDEKVRVPDASRRDTICLAGDSLWRHTYTGSFKSPIRRDSWIRPTDMIPVELKAEKEGFLSLVFHHNQFNRPKENLYLVKTEKLMFIKEIEEFLEERNLEFSWCADAKYLFAALESSISTDFFRELFYTRYVFVQNYGLNIYWPVADKWMEEQRRTKIGKGEYLVLQDKS